MFMDIVVYINFFALGWLCCQVYITYKLRRALKKVAEDNGMSLEEMANKFFEAQGLQANVIKVPNYFTEVANNSILLYSKEKGKFIGQAETVEELAENLYKFNKVKFALVTHNERQFWFVEGRVQNDLKNI